MRFYQTAAKLTIIAFVAGCGSAETSLPNPSREEASKAIGRLLQATNVGFSSFVGPGQPTQCQIGKVGDTTVQTCKVCATTLYGDGNNNSYGNVRLAREEFDVAFKRALSFEQPDIEPADARSGVWVAIVPDAPMYAPAQVPRSVIGEARIDQEMAVRLLGIGGEWRPPSGFWFNDGGQPVSYGEVFTRLANLPAQEKANLVGTCEGS